MDIAEMDGLLTVFGCLIPGLQAGGFDAIMARMDRNPARYEKVLFVRAKLEDE